jgi:hypothetical protein
MKKKKPPLRWNDDYTGPIALPNTVWVWLTEDEWEYVTWFEALKAIDVHDDTAPFLTLLKTVVPPVVFPHIQDLFERKPPTKRNHGPAATPSYARSNADARLELSAMAVDDRVKAGMPVKDAVEQVASADGYDPSTLANYIDDKRGSSRRMKKRRPAPIKPRSGR